MFGIKKIPRKFRKKSGQAKRFTFKDLREREKTGVYDSVVEKDGI
jgi:hypothetical protein